MKHLKYNILLFLIVSKLSAQVGVNTINPNASLDIRSNELINLDATPEGIMVPRLTKSELGAKSVGTYGVNQIGVIVYVTSASVTNVIGASSNQVNNTVDEPGFYFLYSDLTWRSLLKLIDNEGDQNNIYNSDGDLLSDRIVDQKNNTISFKGNTINNFSVLSTSDNTPIISVDNLNNRVGIGTSTPTNEFHINSSTSPALRLNTINKALNNILISDVNGNGRWQDINAISNTIFGEPNSFLNLVQLSSSNTLIGSQITLDPGTWVIYIGQFLKTTTAAVDISDTNTNNRFTKISISTSRTSYTANPNPDYRLASDFLSGYLSPSLINGEGYTFISGVIPVKITEQTTFYTWSVDAITNSSSISPEVVSNPNNYIFAYPAISQN